jgi:hypothetical protein
LCYHFSSHEYLNKDPFVWLDGARPVNSCIPPSFLGSAHAQLNGVPKNKVCLQVYENGCLQVLKEETGREQFDSSQSYEFGHTLLCNLSPTWMFNKPAFGLTLKHKTSLKNLPKTNTPAYFAAALLFPWECTCAAERWVCIFASIKKLANFGKFTFYYIFSIRESVWQTDFGQHWICLM